MGKNKKPKINKMYDEAERTLLARLCDRTMTTDEMASELRNLKMLEEARSAKPANKISADTATKCGTSFLSLLMTLGFELGPNPHLIRSKGFGFIPKIKL